MPPDGPMYDRMELMRKETGDRRQGYLQKEKNLTNVNSTIPGQDAAFCAPSKSTVKPSLKFDFRILTPDSCLLSPSIRLLGLRGAIDDCVEQKPDR